MTPVTFRFFNKKTGKISGWQNGMRKNPSLGARNWYRSALNQELQSVVQYHGSWDASLGYNTVEFTNGRTMRVARVDQTSLTTVRFEVIL